MPVGDLQSLLWAQAPVIKTITLAGAMTPGGVVIKQVAKNLSGAVSPTSTPPSKTPSKQYAGTTTASGALLKTLSKNLTATLTSSATTTKFAQHQQAVSGAISPTGTVANLRTAQRSFTGQMFSGGSVSKFPSKLWSGAMTSTGTLSAAATHVRTFQSTTSSVGALSNSIQKPLAGSLTALGDLQKTWSKLLSGTISPASSLFRTITKPLIGSSTSSGAVTIFVARLQSFGGALTPSGTISFGIEKVSFSAFAPTGAFEKGVEKIWSGTLTPSSTLLKEIPKAFAGAVTSAGTLTTLTTRTFTISLSGQIAPSGIVETVFVEAPLVVVETRTPGFRKSRARPTVTAVPRTYAKLFDGSVSFAGHLELSAELRRAFTVDDIVSLRVIPRPTRVDVADVVPALPTSYQMDAGGTFDALGTLDFERVLFVDSDELILDGGLFNAD